MDKIIEHINQNKIVYIVCALALLACVYTIFSVEGWHGKVDDEWKGFINEQCVCYINKPASNTTFKLMTPKEMLSYERDNTTIEYIDEVDEYGIEDFYKDTEGLSFED